MIQMVWSKEKIMICVTQIVFPSGSFELRAIYNVFLGLDPYDRVRIS